MVARRFLNRVGDPVGVWIGAKRRSFFKASSWFCGSFSSAWMRLSFLSLNWSANSRLCIFFCLSDTLFTSFFASSWCFRTKAGEEIRWTISLGVSLSRSAICSPSAAECSNIRPAKTSNWSRFRLSWLCSIWEKTCSCFASREVSSKLSVKPNFCLLASLSVLSGTGLKVDSPLGNIWKWGYIAEKLLLHYHIIFVLSI